MGVRILFVEDSQDDVELQLRRLREAGLEPEWHRVQTEDALRAALAGDPWQLALVDYNIPGFSGLEALRLIAELAPDLPAITVSGSIDEDTAVATMSAGAVEYVLKDNLTRLAPAVQRAIEAASLRCAQRHAAQDLRTERASLAAIFEASPVAMLVFDERLSVVRLNRAAMVLAGNAQGELLQHQRESEVQCGDLLGCVQCGDDDQACGSSDDCPLCPLRNGIAAVIDGRGSLHGVELAMHLDRGHGPETVWIRMGAEPMSMNGARHTTVALDDITERKQAEEQLRGSEARFRLFAEQIPGFVSMKDSRRRYVFLSASDRADLGEDGDLWEGKTPGELWTRREAAHIDSVTERVLGGDVVDEIIEWQHGDVAQYLHALHFPVPGEGGAMLVGGVSINVTDQVEAQEEVRRQAEQLRRTVEGAVLAMGHVVETRDPYTAGHERRVSELATAVGREMGLEADVLDGLRLAGLIHDIGKISVPAEILAKPGRLSDVEFNLIKQHSQAGYDILAVIDFGRPVAEIVLQHHERLDGSGYPRGLSGEGLLPEARILAVADVVEAMSSHRPYRPALGIEVALDEIREGAGSRYDAEAAATCVKVFEEQGFAFTP